MLREHWERNAANWAAWATTPDFDSYWSYSTTFFDLIPPPGTRTLEVGCGEGRVSRDLAARGHDVVGLDSSPTLIHLARQTAPAIAFVIGDAAALPFPDRSFDTVVYYNSLMDFDNMDAGVDEGARVLQVGGSFCASVTHPFQDAGKFVDTTPESAFVVDENYLEHRRPIDAPVDRDGRHMHFKGWAYPLEAYSRALERNGLVITALREPGAPPEIVASDPANVRWQRMPLFAMWRAVKAA